MRGRPDGPPTGWQPVRAAEPGLAGQIRRESGIGVLTGGQTGVDTEAAIAALRAGLPVHLVFPRGLLQEDGPLSQVRREQIRGAHIHELRSPLFSHRTWTCVDLSDAVILIDPAGGDGCGETARAARCLGRPLLDLSAARRGTAPATVGDWLRDTAPGVLMLAGCRGSLLAAAGLERDAAGLVAVVMAAVVRTAGQ